MNQYLLTIGTILMLIIAFCGCVGDTDGEGDGDSSSQVGNQLPTASCSANPMSGTEPLIVYFIGSGSDTDGYIVSYYWNFGDGETSSSKSPSHTYQNSGVYIARLTVTDDDGDTDSDSVTITVEEKVIPPDFEIVTKDSYLDLDSYILYLYATVYNNGGPGRVKVWVQGAIDECGWDVKKLKTPYLESGESTELTFTLRGCAPLSGWAVSHNVWIGADTSNPNTPIDFEIVAKNHQIVDDDTFYYYVTVYNNGGAGYGKVWTSVTVEEPNTGYDKEKLQTPYLESGESTELTFTFEKLGLWGEWQVSHDAWIE